MEEMLKNRQACHSSTHRAGAYADEKTRSETGLHWWDVEKQRYGRGQKGKGEGQVRQGSNAQTMG